MKKPFAVIVFFLLLICSSASSYDSSGLSSLLGKDANIVRDFFNGTGDINQASSSYNRLYELFYEDADTFILNTNSGKYHYDDCPWGPELNKKEIFCSRNLLESMGYSPCGHCHPEKKRQKP